MKTIEERFLKIGARVLNEYLTHGKSVEITIERSETFGMFKVDVNVHPVIFFDANKMNEVKYRASRTELPEEGQKQLDELWKLEREDKK